MSLQAPSLGTTALPAAPERPRHAGDPPASVQDVDDVDLIRRTTRGDGQAFEVLMRRHNQKLYRAARSILLNDADAEEAVQEAWWKAYRHFENFRGDAKPATWLTRIAINEALMQRRRNKARAAVIESTEHTLPDDDMPAIPPSAPQTLQPDTQLHVSELRGALEAQIDALPEIYRTAFMLCGVDQMSARDAAKALGITAVTVRVRYMRARRMLRTALAQQLDISHAGAFSFAGERCDRIVARVQQRLRDSLPQ